MARISGVDIPREKRVEISLTYIFGIGRTTCAADLRRHRHQPRTPASATSPTTRSVAIRVFIDQNLKVEGDLRREVAGHQAQDGDRLLPGHPPSSRPSGPRPAHPHQCPHPQGPEEDRGRQEERSLASSIGRSQGMAKPAAGAVVPAEGTQERHATALRTSRVRSTTRS